MKFLLGELTGKRPLMPPTLQTSAEQADVINTFRTIAQLPPDSLGAYVISMARSASDVLAVVLLQASSTSSTMPDLSRHYALMVSPLSFLLASALVHTLPRKDKSSLCVAYVSFVVRNYSSQTHFSALTSTATSTFTTG